MPSLRYSMLASALSFVKGMTAMESTAAPRGRRAKNQIAKTIKVAARATAASVRRFDHHGFTTRVATMPESATPLSLVALGELLSRLRR